MDDTQLPPAFTAARHPPEYRLHKYWARKPANVAAALLSALVAPGGAVLDPFCGSGVILAEARALGLQATGIDLNPAASLIASVTANPPDPAHFLPALDRFLTAAETHIAPLYGLPDGASVRYCVHSSVVACPDCMQTVSAWALRDHGRKKHCPGCGARLRFNLRTLTSTEIVRVVTEDGAPHTTPALLDHQHRASTQTGPSTFLKTRLLPNRRILTWDGLTAADLLTPRNRAAAEILRGLLIENGTPTQQALRAMLTASLAGMSRLVAFRDGLRGGGPAWTVPGFWVAPVHVEHNPLPLLRSWARRYQRGIPRLWERLHSQPPATLHTGPAQAILPTLHQSYDLIFLDPPYGDSVPYLEFSALWNMFLGVTPDYTQEVVVSNRTAERAWWPAYAARLAEVVAASEARLKSHGAVVVTFNNRDSRAWGALLEALHRAGLYCAAAHYVAPAVVSAKAQFAPDGSYHGDFWCVFRRGVLADIPRDRWRDVLAAAVPHEITDPQRRRRLALRALLTANLPAEAIALVDGV